MTMYRGSVSAIGVQFNRCCHQHQQLKVLLLTECRRPRLLRTQRPIYSAIREELQSVEHPAWKSLRRRVMFGVFGTIFSVFATGFGWLQYQKMKWRKLGTEIFYMPVDIKPWMRWMEFPSVVYKGTMVNNFMLNNIQRLEKFQVRRDDVYVVSYPKSGTTWTQEIVYLIMNDADVSKAKSANMDQRFPFLEELFINCNKLAKRPSPRLIKTHLPCHLLPPGVYSVKPRIIYIARNPKDSIVSYYHFMKCIKFPFKGYVEDFAELFLNDKLLYCPWADHLLGYWEMRNEENILFIRYEDLKLDFQGTVKRMARHLGKELTDEQMARIQDHCSFESMKNNSMANNSWWDKRGWTRNMGNRFMRKGVIGDGKTHFSAEFNERLDKYVAEKLAGSELTFTEPSKNDN